MSLPPVPQQRFGARLKARRKQLGQTQRQIAESVGISTAYLNLIENNRRPLGDSLLSDLVAVLGMDSDQLNDASDLRLAEELEDLRQRWRAEFDDLSAPDRAGLPDGFSMIDFSRGWSQILASQQRVIQRLDQMNRSLADRFNEDPEIAKQAHTMLTKTTAIRTFSEILQEPGGTTEDEQQRFMGIISSQSVELGENIRGLIELFETRMQQPAANSAREEIENFIIDRGNHFPTLELGAGDLRVELGIAEDAFVRDSDLLPLLKARNLSVEIKTDWNAATTRFQLAKRLCQNRLIHSIEDLVVRGSFHSDEAKARAAHALSNYAASAFLFPYSPFLKAAEELRYDVDLLVDRFGGGFEQVAHRLATLKRPGQTGLAFGFMRVDPAGNISKRLNLPGLSMPRAGSACPLWIAYEAFQTPGRTVSQLAELPDGQRFVLVAKAVEKRHRAFMRPAGRFSIMVALNWDQAQQTVYGDLYSGGGAPSTPVGPSCQLCPRTDCPQRAEDSLLKL